MNTAQKLLKQPEILAPVANWEMIYAAVHNGADAVYMGMPYFNARGRTTDYSAEEMKSMIDFCHLYGVKVFLACNVLIFEKELSQIEEIFREILPLGPCSTPSCSCINSDDRYEQ
jgi:putative protease